MNLPRTFPSIFTILNSMNLPKAARLKMLLVWTLFQIISALCAMPTHEQNGKSNGHHTTGAAPATETAKHEPKKVLHTVHETSHTVHKDIPHIIVNHADNHTKLTTPNVHHTLSPHSTVANHQMRSVVPQHSRHFFSPYAADALLHNHRLPTSITMPVVPPTEHSGAGTTFASAISQQPNAHFPHSLVELVSLGLRDGHSGFECQTELLKLQRAEQVLLAFKNAWYTQMETGGGAPIKLGQETAQFHANCHAILSDLSVLQNSSLIEKLAENSMQCLNMVRQTQSVLQICVKNGLAPLEHFYRNQVHAVRARSMLAHFASEMSQRCAHEGAFDANQLHTLNIGEQLLFMLLVQVHLHEMNAKEGQTKIFNGEELLLLKLLQTIRFQKIVNEKWYLEAIQESGGCKIWFKQLKIVAFGFQFLNFRVLIYDQQRKAKKLRKQIALLGPKLKKQQEEENHLMKIEAKAKEDMHNLRGKIVASEQKRKQVLDTQLKVIETDLQKLEGKPFVEEVLNEMKRIGRALETIFKNEIVQSNPHGDFDMIREQFAQLLPLQQNSGGAQHLLLLNQIEEILTFEFAEQKKEFERAKEEMAAKFEEYSSKHLELKKKHLNELGEGEVPEMLEIEHKLVELKLQQSDKTNHDHKHAIDQNIKEWRAKGIHLLDVNLKKQQQIIHSIQTDTPRLDALINQMLDSYKTMGKFIHHGGILSEKLPDSKSETQIEKQVDQLEWLLTKFKKYNALILSGKTIEEDQQNHLRRISLNHRLPSPNSSYLLPENNPWQIVLYQKNQNEEISNVRPNSATVGIAKSDESTLGLGDLFDEKKHPVRISLENFQDASEHFEQTEPSKEQFTFSPDNTTQQNIQELLRTNSLQESGFQHVSVPKSHISSESVLATDGSKMMT